MKTKIAFQDRLSLNAGQKYCRVLQREHSAILSTFIKLPVVIKLFLSILSGRLRRVLLYLNNRYLKRQVVYVRTCVFAYTQVRPCHLTNRILARHFFKHLCAWLDALILPSAFTYAPISYIRAAKSSGALISQWFSHNLCQIK